MEPGGQLMIMVTGGTGLLGSHVLYALLQTEERVAALKRPTATLGTLREIFSFYVKDPEPLINRIDWREGDLSDPDSLLSAIRGMDIIINCAAIVSFDSTDKKRLISNNIDGTRNLADAIRIYQKQCPGVFLVHISSTAALGDSPGNDPDFLIDEATPRNPDRHHNSYSVSKFGSEQVIRELGTAAVILNPGIILGPGQWSKGSSQLFVKGWHGIRFYPYGGTGYVDVRDLAALILLVTDRRFGGERFCVVGANLRFREFFNRVTDEFGKPNPSVYAGRFLSGLAWRTDTLRSRLTGKKPLLTREAAHSAQRISFYSSKKLQIITGFSFRPIEETIEWITACYKKVVRSSSV